ncbi:MAG: hypothetical protein U0228_26140 [Myxococcaceae bacterium]
MTSSPLLAAALFLLTGCGAVTVVFPGESSCAQTCGSGLVCDASLQRCVECRRHTDCPSSTPVCDDSKRRCLPCKGAMGCAAGQECRDSVCVVACNDASPCAAFASGCVDGVCAQCAGEDECPSGHCVLGRCVACRENGDCAGATPRCQPWTGTCVACLGPEDCPEHQACDRGTCR